MAEPEKPLQVMADANILIAGILFPRWFHEFLRHALRGDFKLVLSAQTIREARERVARGTFVQQRALKQFLADCDYELVPDPSRQEVEKNASLVRDPKDIPTFETRVQSFSSRAKLASSRLMPSLPKATVTSSSSAVSLASITTPSPNFGWSTWSPV
jgi:predicted nucleic acid-binding protein